MLISKIFKKEFRSGSNFCVIHIFEWRAIYLNSSQTVTMYYNLFRIEMLTMSIHLYNCAHDGNKDCLSLLCDDIIATNDLNWTNDTISKILERKLNDNRVVSREEIHFLTMIVRRRAVSGKWLGCQLLSSPSKRKRWFALKDQCVHSTNQGLWYPFYPPILLIHNEISINIVRFNPNNDRRRIQSGLLA